MAHLIASGCGRIINTTSESFLGMELLSSYGAAKVAIIGLNRNVAVEDARHGIGRTASPPAPERGWPPRMPKPS
jgi:NAD(P)-dependent dehydrogenase (short-subunit alcohol dehydrogenase family)